MKLNFNLIQIKFGFVILIVFFLFNCENKKYNSKNISNKRIKNKIIDSDQILHQFNKKLLYKDKKLKDDLIKKNKFNDFNKLIKNENNWVLKINKKKISKKYFDMEYNYFLKLVPKKISKRNFFKIFIQKFILKSKLKNHIKSLNPLLIEIIKKQILVNYYIQKKILVVKSFSDKNIKDFYYLLLKQKKFKNLDFKKDQIKINYLYQLQESNRLYFNLSNKLKSEYQIIINDKWRNGILEKYVKNKYDHKKAIGKNYRDFWLYKIKITNSSKLNKDLNNDKEKIVYIKDIEKQIFLLNNAKKFKIQKIKSKEILKKFKKNITIRKQFLDRYLVEELIYQKLIDEKLIFTNEYKNLQNQAKWHYVNNDYLINILHLDTDKKRQNYFNNIIESNKIQVNNNFLN